MSAVGPFAEHWTGPSASAAYNGEGAGQPQATEPQHAHAFSWEPCACLVRSSESRAIQCRDRFALSLEVQMDKPLTWDAEKGGWRWHKTWRLPGIRVGIQLPAAGRGELDTLAGCEVMLQVVCGSPRPNEMENVGVLSASSEAGEEMDVTTQVVDGECRFSRLKLRGTSNTHGGRRFHMVISVLRRRPESLYSEPEVLASVISSAFSVYSRKDADKKRRKPAESVGPGNHAPPVDGENQVGNDYGHIHPQPGAPADRKVTHHYQQTHAPFHPDLFTKQFVKKRSENGQAIHEPIDNSSTGLVNYFQAPNIRFKSRHPILLAVQFSSVLVIVRDRNSFPLVDERALQQLLCACGFPANCRLPHCHSCMLRRAAALNSEGNDFLPLWCISMRPGLEGSPDMLRWLVDHLQCVKSPMIGFVPDMSMLPVSYAPTENLDELVSLYSRMFALENASWGGASNPTPGKPLSSPEPPLKWDNGAPAGNMVLEGPSDMDISRQNQINSQTRYPLQAHQSAQTHQKVGQTAQNISSQFTPSKAHESHADVDPPGANNGSELVKGAFAEYFIGLHSELRQLLTEMIELASLSVAEPTPEVLGKLRLAYFQFTEAMAVHAFVQDTVLFPELTKRVPGVTEAYVYDHYKEANHLTMIHASIDSVNAEKTADLFLQISGFAAIHIEHLEKEEEHLLPYFLSMFADDEVVQLFQRSDEAARVTRSSRTRPAVSAAIATGGDSNNTEASNFENHRQTDGAGDGMES